MTFHFFHFTPNGIIRAFWHLSAGLRISHYNFRSFISLIPGCINSMMPANNFARMGLPPARTILDAGANSSQMTRLLCMASKSTPAVFSFEPNPNLSPLGRVFGMGLSNRDSDADFYLSPDSNWSTFDKNALSEKIACRKIQVPLRRFDSLVKSGEIDVSSLQHPILLKVDTEGADLEVLEGFGDYLREVDYVIVEVSNAQDGHHSRNNHTPIVNLLGGYGFQSKVLYAAHDGSDMPVYLDMLFWRPAPAGPEKENEP